MLLHEEEEEIGRCHCYHTFDGPLTTKYASQMLSSCDYKIRRWAGLLIFLRYYLLRDALCMNTNQELECIYLQLMSA